MPLTELPGLSRYLNEKNGGLKPGWVVAGSPVTLSSPHITSQVPANTPDASLSGLCPAIPISPKVSYTSTV